MATQSQTKKPRKIPPIILVVVIGFLLFSVRCAYQLEKSEDELASGIQSLALALTTNQSDYSAARSLFMVASRLNFADTFPRFCLSALDEIEGEWSPTEVPPESWHIPIEQVRNGQFVRAKESFSTLELDEGMLRNRAQHWGQLLNRLILETPQSTNGQSTAQ